MGWLWILRRERSWWGEKYDGSASSVTDLWFLSFYAMLSQGGKLYFDGNCVFTDSQWEMMAHDQREQTIRQLTEENKAIMTRYTHQIWSDWVSEIYLLFVLEIDKWIYLFCLKLELKLNCLKLKTSINHQFKPFIVIWSEMAA